MLRIFIPEHTQSRKWKEYLRTLKTTSEHSFLFPCAYHSPKEQQEWAQEFIPLSIIDKDLVTIVTTSEIIIRELQCFIASHPELLDSVHIFFISTNSTGEIEELTITLEPNGFFKESWKNGYFDVAFNQSIRLIKTPIKS